VRSGCLATVVWFSLACGASADETAKPTPPVIATDAKGYHCIKAKLDFARRCPANPNFGKTKAQLRAEAVKKAKAAKQARLAAARAAAARRARLAREAAARRAQIAAENAWHKGYYEQDTNVYWRWIEGRDCSDYVDYCWHVEVITRDGCPSYVAVEANEYEGTAVVGDLLDNNGNGLPPKTPAVFELMSQGSGGTKAGDVNITCA
jgi:hypothetical protein